MKITLKEIRLSFPNIWRPKSVNNSEPRFSANFLLDKKEDAAQIDALRKAVAAVKAEQWKGKKVDNVKFCVHDGKEKSETEGYGEAVVFITTSNKIRPKIVDRDRAELHEEDGKPYAGCRVNAAIRLWAQDNQFGRRINAQLLGIQFVRDDEAFGDKPFNAEEEFPDLGEGETKTAGATAGSGNAPPPDDDEIPF